MRLSLVLLSCFSLSPLVQAQELPVGTQSENVQFSILDGGLRNTDLSEFAGQIVAIYYYTPW